MCWLQYCQVRCSSITHKKTDGKSMYPEKPIYNYKPFENNLPGKVELSQEHK